MQQRSGGARANYARKTVNGEAKRVMRTRRRTVNGAQRVVNENKTKIWCNCDSESILRAAAFPARRYGARQVVRVQCARRVQHACVRAW